MSEQIEAEADSQTEESEMDFEELTLAEIVQERPDVLKEHDASTDAALATLEAEHKALKEECDKLEREGMIAEKLTKAELPEVAVSEHFRGQLADAKDEAAIDALIEDRKEVADKLGRKRGGPVSTERQQDPGTQNGITPVSEQVVGDAIDKLFH